MSDTLSTLLHRVRDPADAGAWREFVELYRPLLLAYMQRQGRSGPDADDVVQDVLARLVRALPRFDLNRVSGRFRTWLWQVTRNALVDDARRRRRRECAERAHAGQAHPGLDGVQALITLACIKVCASVVLTMLC
jgi:RNA polymerase sigma-70 factor (ECF subfamily)